MVFWVLAAFVAVASGAAVERGGRPMKTPTEASITRAILKYLNSLPGCRAIKSFGSGRRAGEPDIYCVYRGRFFALEVKRPGGKPTRLQALTLEKWERAGAVAAVVHSVAEVRAIIEGEGAAPGVGTAATG